MSRRQVLAAATAVPLLGMAGTASAARPPSGLSWAGRSWTVRSGTGGPGPNTWSGSGPYVADGALHLRVRRGGDARWTCSEVFAPSLGFGTYEWTVRGPVGQLDANVVLGLFTYETDTRETDLELARWGGVDAHNAQYAVQPATAGNLLRFTVTAQSALTLRYRWTPGRAEFSGQDDGRALPAWVNDRATTSRRGKVHMNLWLFQGRPPTDGRDVDVALTGFSFRPA